ncbi:MAG: hypothetical protein ABSE48_03535 [Verrucomicrobiota bacterium]
MKRTCMPIQITLFLLALYFVPVAVAGPLDTWTWRNPKPTGNYLSSVATGVVNGTSEFVAVGFDSTILTSQAGVTWYQQTCPPNITLTGVAFGNTTFVAVGSDSTSGNAAILTSSDGSTWLPVTVTSGSLGLVAVTYGGGQFVAVGSGGTILTSPDGNNWTLQTSHTGSTLDGVAYGGGLFVAVGSGGTIVTSSDGVTWTASTSGTPYVLAGVAYGDGVWAAVGQSIFLVSFNGIAWGSALTGYSAGAVTFDNNDNLFVAWDNEEQPGLFTSTDALNWKVQGPSTAGTTALYNALTYNSNNRTFVAVGANGGIAISTSPYGTNWITQTISSNSEPLNAIAYGVNSTYPGGVFVAGGGMLGGNTGSMLYSSDGINWSIGQLNGSVSYGTVVSGIAYGQVENAPIFVAAGSAYSIGQNGVVLASLDGVNWVQTYSTSSSINTLNAVIFGNGEFMTVGSHGAILTSPDAVNWTPQTSSTTSVLYGATYGGGLFVAVGSGGEIVKSTDGVTWMAANSGPNSTLYGVAYGNGSYVAVGESSSYYPVIMTSPDGNTWSVAYTGLTPYSDLTGITFNNGTFVATGQNGQILTSPTGLFGTWTSRASGAGNQLNAVVFGESQFIAVGTSGTILGSDQPSPPPVPRLATPAINFSSGTIQMPLTGGTPGSTAILLASPDLKNWVPITSATVDVNGNASLSDTLVPNIPGRYYRVAVH